jgi:hypothetical protein
VDVCSWNGRAKKEGLGGGPRISVAQLVTGCSLPRSFRASSSDVPGAIIIAGSFRNYKFVRETPASYELPYMWKR